ncbi:MAG: hypothetical protein ACLQGP_42250 [Isosphaeraceae bacterium]
MLAHSRLHRQARRGIVLVLVLAMLGLLALIGVTFATFSGQAKINARNFAQGVLEPQDDELMDFALAQLIVDTSDVRSAIRGHSLARDMYGSDANYNGYLPLHPTYGTPFYITGVSVSNTGVYTITTNIQSNDPNFYGYHFPRWIMRVGYNGSPGTTTVNSPYQTAPGSSGSLTTVSLANHASPAQTIEIIGDSGYNSTSSAYRTFTIGYLDGSTNLINWGYENSSGGMQTASTSPLPGQYLAYAAANNVATGTSFPFSLDGRWLHAFNGPGMGSQTTTIPLGTSTLTVPLSTYGNFRYNASLVPKGPGSADMDEDYDACDLENWFLAIQSADGQVMIPSFHRPGVVRHDPLNPNTPFSDWSATYRFPGGVPNPDSLSRILRPVAADGNDAQTFPDLIPDPTTGKVARYVGTTQVGTGFDVDNDADGINDSVWLDLGYPSRRDSRGQLYKPLFAFMVIGLNGRIPLNTAGNLAGSGSTHAQHLGNSVSEIDPTYALQNAYNSEFDPFSTANTNITWPPSATIGSNTYTTYNTQVDNAIDAVSTDSTYGSYKQIDVRLTQHRNLLAGTRPQPNPLTAPTAANGDANSVYGSWAGSTTNQPYYLPNGIADGSDIASSYTDTSGNITVQRTSPPVGGRWGEAPSVPGVPFLKSSMTPPVPANLIQTNYANPVRAGYSFDITDLLSNLTNNGNTPFPRDSADDNFNAFDAFPPRLTGEIGDADFYDSVGGLLMPVERWRRFVTPADINGTGSVKTWGSSSNLGADNFGRVQFSSYFRPAGVAGAINTTTQQASPTTESYDGAIGYGTWSSGALTLWGSGTSPTTYVPDVTNNPLHGYEWYKLPTQFQVPGVAPAYTKNTNPQTYGGMPTSPSSATGSNALNTAWLTANGATIPTSYTVVPPATAPAATPPSLPTVFPTYDNAVNSEDRSDGVNDADEMNLYAPNPLLDSPYGPTDIEWLYRQQDVDGATLTSRLSQLAPISFTNTLDGQRRRRLFSLDSSEPNNFVWANDNPQGAFAYNRRFGSTASPSFAGLSLYTPALAQRDKTITLNYPRPVSNDCNEPVRQKWIGDTYLTLKAILPPDAVDTAEERAQLSQFVINIIDFRDPDATMTHWVNPDVYITPGTATPAACPTLSFASINANSVLLDQYGMEYNPVAINETLAYSFQSRPTQGQKNTTLTNRFFIELVNTLTAAYNPSFDYGSPTVTYSANNYYGYGPSHENIDATYSSPTNPNQASTLSLGGLTYAVGDPYGGGCWDLVFTADTPMARPDPYRGELLYNPTSGTPTYFGLIPLNRDSLATTSGVMTATPNPNAPNQGDVTLLPISPTASTATGSALIIPVNPNPATVTTPAAPPTTYYYVIANPTTGPESFPLSPTANNSGNNPPPVTQFLTSTYDPLNPGSAPPTPTYRAGILPAPSTTTQFSQITNYTWDIPYLGNVSGSGGPPTGAYPSAYYWVCLRRPANPFAPVSAANPMCVVDSMRFPYIDGSGTWSTSTDTSNWYYMVGGSKAPTIYSAQRLQPYRGGHAVPMPNDTGTVNMPPDPRYGYSDQIAVPQTICKVGSGNNYLYGLAHTTAGSSVYAATNAIYNTLGAVNDSAENWDYFVFNDRDFSSVAELMLVPGCPPGLFTKQFVEFAPSMMNAADIFATVNTLTAPSQVNTPTSAMSGASTAAASANTTPTAPLSAPSAIGSLSTATVPFLSVSQATSTSAIGSKPTGTPPPGLPLTVPALSPSLTQPGSPTTPVQPHAYPYLVDKFYYTGASTFLYPPLMPTNSMTLAPGNPGTTDPSNAGVPVVGGPAADGWFKMFDFFEVPSQAIGAIGPVAQGANFDWMRQDYRSGLMNLNLIVDEEAYFAIFGQQGTSGFNQTLLNSIELPLLTLSGSSGNYLPYQLPLSTWTNGGTLAVPPIPLNGPPVPLVVSAIQASGAPNYVYPITDQTQYVQHGYLAGDPISSAINTALGVTQPAVGNRLKASFAQFLWMRHGGSGYMFGYGNGMTGQNSAITTPTVTVNVAALPAELPFRSLSFPDIDHTIMRPAALPPSIVSNPTMLTDSNNFALTPVINAQSVAYQTSTTDPPTTGNWYWLNTSLSWGANPTQPIFYAPFVATGNSNFAASTPIVYTGDPGVRNPFLSQGYAASNTSVGAPYSTALTANSVPAGIPLPINVAFPPTTAGSAATTDAITMPPAIPPARLFQIPDDYGAGAMASKSYTGIYDTMADVATTATGNLPPAVSNATDSGDPWINNQVANQVVTPGAPVYPTYTLNNGFTNLMWSGGSYSSSASSAGPFVSSVGVLPPTSVNYLPYSLPAAPTTPPGNLTLYNGYSGTASSANPYLGSNTGATTDDRQHPYWRTENLQKVMNLTTVRTHQYAVWITVGFFEVKKVGDIGMLIQGQPQLAYDIMGPEVGALSGNSTRYRGFFLVNRLNLTGFNPANVGSFRAAVVYRKVIQ